MDKYLSTSRLIDERQAQQPHKAHETIVRPHCLPLEHVALRSHFNQARRRRCKVGFVRACRQSEEMDHFLLEPSWLGLGLDAMSCAD